MCVLNFEEPLYSVLTDEPDSGHPLLELWIQGYLAHKKPPPPPRTAIGPYAYAYCRVLGGGVFL